jgi:hypothetical protein
MVMRIVEDWSPPDRVSTQGPYRWRLSFFEMQSATVLKPMQGSASCIEVTAGTRRALTRMDTWNRI